VVSGENVDYLKKAVQESLSASLQGKGGIKVVEIPQTEEDLKKKGLSKVLKGENLNALLTGSIVKIGAPVQINTRLYQSEGTEPLLISHTADPVERLLPTLKIHAQAILEQLNRPVDRLQPTVAAPVVAPPAPVEAKPFPPKETEKKSVKKG